MLRIALCDDVPAHSDALCALIRQVLPEECELTVYSAPDALLSEVSSHAFDLFFLDVELGEESGIRLAAELNSIFPQAQIIFVTSNLANAVDVSDVNHAYFLVKPVDPEKLRAALDRVRRLLAQSVDRRIVIPLRGGGEAFVTIGDLLYCERIMRTTTLRCREEDLYTNLNLEALEAMLPGNLFARPHNSYLVNLMHVVRMDRMTVWLEGGASLSISNQRRNGFRQALSSFAAQG